jgi:hypothetical protein
MTYKLNRTGFVGDPATFDRFQDNVSATENRVY